MDIYALYVRHISIHTPTQGVTAVCHGGQPFYGISIHTPTQGVTMEDLLRYMRVDNFNPHSHAGSDFAGGGQ